MVSLKETAGEGKESEQQGAQGQEEQQGAQDQEEQQGAQGQEEQHCAQDQEEQQGAQAQEEQQGAQGREERQTTAAQLPTTHHDHQQNAMEEATTNTPTEDGDTRNTSQQDPGTEEDMFKKPVFVSASQRVRRGERHKTMEAPREPVKGPEKDTMQSTKSPAQKLADKAVPIPYKEPVWSGAPEEEYWVEVLKSGVIMEQVPLKEAVTVLGRLAQCHLVMEHPSISRFHCILQYRGEEGEGQGRGFYAYDLDSTHGSFHNKHRMKPHTYYRLHVGHMLKLGGSTRMLILQGPEEDQEPETHETAKELMDAAARQKEEQLKKKQEQEEEEQGKGVDWGMGDDAEEEEEIDEEGDGENPFASVEEELNLDDPKKTLRGWFEREGLGLPEYQTEDLGPARYVCKVELPVVGEKGEAVVARVEHRGKKKDAVVQCAMEACRLLDRHGVLRQAKHESHQRKKRSWAENDYYDSDEDDFLDRTGDVQRKRAKRMKEAGRTQQAEPLTYESLSAQYSKVIKELEELEGRLAEAGQAGQQGGQGAEDDLDAFMNALQTQVPDKHQRITWKLRVVELKKEEARLRRLANVARPFGVGELQPYQSRLQGPEGNQKKEVQGMASNQEPQEMPSSTKQTKRLPFKVHKIFEEEEPEKKLRLRRLDDDDDEEEAAPQTASRPQTTRTSKLPTNYSPRLHIAKMPGVQRQRQPGRSEGKSARDATTATVISQLQKDELKLTNNGSKMEEVNSRLKDAESTEKSQDKSQSEARGSARSPEVTEQGAESAKPCVGASEEKNSGQKPRILGPTLPPQLAHRASTLQNTAKSKKKAGSKKLRKYDEETPNYDTWLPPSHQTGDGRTSLNDKLGY